MAKLTNSVSDEAGVDMIDTPDVLPKQGALKELPVTGLLRRALSQRSTGRLVVIEGKRVRHLVLSDGLPICVWGSVKHESLLWQLSRSKRLDRKRINELGSDEFSALESLHNDSEVDPDVTREVVATIGSDVLKLCFAITDGTFEFSHEPLTNSLASLIDPFRTYVDYLEECVPSEKLVREVARRRSVRLVMTAAGRAHQQLLRRSLRLAPKLEVALQDNWTIADLLSRASGNIDTTARVLTAFFELGVVRTDTAERADSGGGDGLARIYRGMSSRTTPRRESNTSSGMQRARSGAAATANILFLDGLTYLHLGDLEEAQDHFRRAWKMEPSIPFYRAWFGWTLILRPTNHEATDHKMGRTAILEAAEIDPESDMTQLVLGKLLALDGDTEHAIEAYRRAVEINPANAEARTALTALELTLEPDLL